MKPVYIVYYATDSGAAKAKSAELRDLGKQAFVRQATAYGGEQEPCDFIVIMPDVGASDRARLEAVYGAKVFGESPVAVVDMSKLEASLDQSIIRSGPEPITVTPRRSKLSLPKKG